MVANNNDQEDDGFKVIYCRGEKTQNKHNTRKKKQTSKDADDLCRTRRTSRPSPFQNQPRTRNLHRHLQDIEDKLFVKSPKPVPTIVLCDGTEQNEASMEKNYHHTDSDWFLSQKELAEFDTELSDEVLCQHLQQVEEMLGIAPNTSQNNIPADGPNRYGSPCARPYVVTPTKPLEPSIVTNNNMSLKRGFGSNNVHDRLPNKKRKCQTKNTEESYIGRHLFCNQQTISKIEDRTVKKSPPKQEQHFHSHHNDQEEQIRRHLEELAAKLGIPCFKIM